MGEIKKKENYNFNIISDKENECDCPFNDTDCPGGMYCSKDEY